MLSFSLSRREGGPDRPTFAEIYNEYRYLCLHVALDITGDRAMAEDAVHNAFTALLEKKEKYFSLPRCKLKSLIVIITKNKAIDLLRKEKRRDATPVETVPDDGFDISQQVASDEAYAHLLSCVSKLPEPYRVVLQMRYLHEMSNKEIAEQMGESQNIIAMKIHRAKQRLKDILIAEDNDHE